MHLKCKQVAAVIALSLAAFAAVAPARPRQKTPAAKPSRHKWGARAARASQPKWITPLATTSALLKQGFRFDEVRQVAPNGAVTAVSFHDKGLELIPTEHIEVTVGVPSYFGRGTGSTARSGWDDFPIQVKYRIFSAPEGKGNYAVSAGVGASFPTGTNGNGAGKVVLKPAIAFGKGWGNFDAQVAFGASLPTGAWQRLGTPLALNAAFQYHTLGKLWPEVEVNSTAWPNGPNQGKKETFLTPGVIVGRFPLGGSVRLNTGVGLQIAATHFHRTNHNLILKVKFSF